MQYQIDQSGKVEQTNQPTVVALSNGQRKSIKISAVEKQRLIKQFKTFDYPKHTYIYRIFAGLIFLLIKDGNFKSVEIDVEYSGHENTIKNIVIQLLRKYKKPIPAISFALVGKTSNAHKTAIAVLRGREKLTRIIKAKEMLLLFYK